MAVQQSLLQLHLGRGKNVNRTLTTLNQLGLGNAGLLTLHYASDVRPIVEDLITTLIDDGLHEPYLDLVRSVPTLPGQSSEALKTFSDVICSISADSRDRQEFLFMVELQVRVFRIWKQNESNHTTENTVRDNCYKHAAQSICSNKTTEWAKASGTPLPMADISSVAKVIYDALLSGKYFFAEMYNLPVEMNKKGEIVLCEAGPEEEWAEVFENLEVQ